MSRRFALIAAAAALAASSAQAGPLGLQKIGPWLVAGWTDSAGKFDRCVAYSKVGNVTAHFVRNSGGDAIVLLNPNWKLTPGKTFKAQITVGSLSGTGEGTTPDSRRIRLAFNDPEDIERFKGASGTMELKFPEGPIGETISIPLTRSADALAALQRCWTERSPALAKATTAPAGVPAPMAESPAPAAPAAPATAATGVIEEETFLPVDIDGKRFRLEVLITRRADLTGKLPIALITHGTAPDRTALSGIRPRLLQPQARDLALRGWLAVAVIRRGYGSSEGTLSDPVRATCAAAEYRAALDADAQDLEAALRALAARPDADPDRVIAIGHSSGGAAVLALAARAPQGLRAVVNISGGLQIIQADGAHCENDQKLVQTFAEFGRRSQVPTLWLYAANDSFFRPKLIRRLRDAFAEARGLFGFGGAEAELMLFRPIGINGHAIFETAEGRLHWLPELDRFLRTRGLPTWDIARLDELMRVGQIDPQLRDLVSRYLSAPSHKVLAASQSGRAVQLRFGFAPGDAPLLRQRVVQECEEIAQGEPCSIVAENFDFGPQPTPTAALDRPRAASGGPGNVR